MKSLQGRAATSWMWLTADPVRVQLAVMLVAALALAVFAALALSGYAAPIAGNALGGSGGSG